MLDSAALGKRDFTVGNSFQSRFESHAREPATARNRYFLELSSINAVRQMLQRYNFARASNFYNVHFCNQLQQDIVVRDNALPHDSSRSTNHGE
jgi:hypothetical protein